jgi:hypothetical protein
LACVEGVYEDEFEGSIGKEFDDLAFYELTAIKSENRDAFEHCAYPNISNDQEEKEQYVQSFDYSLGPLTVPFIGSGMTVLGISGYYGFRRRRAEAKKQTNIQEMSLFK